MSDEKKRKKDVQRLRHLTPEWLEERLKAEAPKPHLVRSLLNFFKRHWSFLCFTPERGDQLQAMLTEIAENKTFPVSTIYFPPGVLWNGEECNAVFVPKSDLDRATLLRGLRRHLGYEAPGRTSDIFTLGVTPEDDEALDRVGLFGKK